MTELVEVFHFRMHDYEFSTKQESQVYFGQLLGMCDYITFPLGELVAMFSTTVLMAEWYRESVSGSYRLEFDSESGQTNALKIDIHSVPA